ncbi:MAG: hypothetical protein FJ087_05080 [Deltaproteobacteria bacterium]|nr:hypothetical protein [Deltaproteobacteria bacterium]
MWKEWVIDWQVVRVRKASASFPVTVLQPESQWADVQGMRTGVFQYQLPRVAGMITFQFEAAATLDGIWTPIITMTEQPGPEDEYAGQVFLSAGLDVDASVRLQRYLRYKMIVTQDDSLVCFRGTAVFNG